jgi:Tfp pilus assembly protein PilF
MSQTSDQADASFDLRAAIDLLAQGNAAAALRAASAACHDAPHLPQVHYVYGQAWLALGDPERAEQAFAAAIQRAPAWAEAWINYGIARYRQGAVNDAVVAMRQALLHAPEHPAASANLGAFLRITGQAEAAETLLRQTLEGEPGNVGARLNLAADLLQEGRPAEALVMLDEMPAANPGAERHWLLQRSLALLELGRGAEARQMLDAFTMLGPVPAALAPLWHWRLLLLANAEGDPARARSEAAAMEAALDTMGPERILEHQIMGHYDLAKFWSGQNEHARAFSHWMSGHKLLAPSQPFSRIAHLALVDANIAHLDKTRFATGPRARDTDPAPVFIVGMPRSGTTLCEQILAAHAQVHGAGERGALGNLAARLGGGNTPAAIERITALDAVTLEMAASAYLADLHALAPAKTRIVDKMPGNYLHLGLVGLLLPGAKIIHCTRDPRDIGLSIFTFRFHGQHGYAHDLADLGWTIAQQSRLMDHWKVALPNPILTVALADWVEDFDGTLARVLAYLDLPPDPNCHLFYQAESRVRTVSRAQVRQPVNARGLGRWKTYEAELIPLIAELNAAAASSPAVS